MKGRYDEIKEQSCQTVRLIFKNQRFKVNKQKLIQKSKYFAALFSPNFKEYYQSEHKIHVEFPLKAIQVSFISLFQKVHHRVNYLIVLSIHYFVPCRFFFHN